MCWDWSVMVQWYGTADTKISNARSDIHQYGSEFSQNLNERDNLLALLNNLIDLRASEIRDANHILAHQNQTIDYLNGNYTAELKFFAVLVDSLNSIPECN